MSFRHCLAVTLTAALAAAQLPVNLTGRVDRVTDPCNSTATHKVGCTDILLRSDTVNLAGLEGRMVDIVGASEGATNCPMVNVTEAVAAPMSTSTLALGGYRINTTVIFTTTAPVGSFVFYFFSCEPAFLPVLTFGTLQLNPFTEFLYWTLDVSIGVAIRSVRIPNEPGLIGQLSLFQTAAVTLTPEFSAKLLNAGCFTIR